MVVSLKANRKRIIAFFILLLVVAGACFFLWHGKQGEEQKAVPGGSNEERLTFLQSFGWQVDPEPTETREVMIPSTFNDVYVTYNVMQQAQGFDLKPYAGMVCTQYQYHITNYPEEDEVYATLLVYGEVIIGGDVACAKVDGFMHGFARDSAHYGETQSGKASPSPAPEKPEKQDMGESAASAAEEETAEAESTAAELTEDGYPTD